MRNMPLMLSLAALACATPLIASDSRDTEIRARTTDAIAKLDERGQKLAKIYLKDRVAGDPVDCIPNIRLRRSTAASDDVLLYDDGSVVYVNTPYLGCPRARDNTMISQTPVGRLCAGDIVLVQDMRIGVPLGSCALSQFVPYRKVKTGE
ncbi:hypothetical protein C7451_101488 [Blastomonas natatoria]|uniref:Uncharacterized protein n=2 Tax=Blastomonas natatoria TaxID=34015 RepID=A0A2V3VCU9_9SPHN|nr:hypothetical protein C7451_101488 [Blastomonas natatoria]